MSEVEASFARIERDLAVQQGLLEARNMVSPNRFRPKRHPC